MGLLTGPTQHTLILEMCKGAVLTAFKESVHNDQIKARAQQAVIARNKAPPRTQTTGEMEADTRFRKPWSCH